MNTETLRPPVLLPMPLLPSVSVWRLSWQQLRRDFRAGELRLLVVAVTLAVAALTAVGFFADRLNHGLARDARQLMGGDAILSSDKPAPATFIDKARSYGLSVATTAGFPSMGRAADAQGGASRLISVKAVSAAYPLRGKLRVDQGQGTAAAEIAGAPQPGTVWVDPGLLDSLSLKVGDPLLLGDATLRIAQRITLEPDRGAGFMSFAPRVMLNEADLAATGLVQPASRVSYRLAVASPTNNDGAVRRYTDWAEAELKAQQLRGIRVESLQAGRPEMTQTLDRAEKFLNLVACWRRCWRRSRWPSPRAISRAATWTIARCCGCWASRSAGSPGSTSPSSGWSACLPASRAWCWASRCTTSSSGCSPAWSTRPCLRRRPGRPCSASASG